MQKLLILLGLFLIRSLFADNLPVYTFPLANYVQQLDILLPESHDNRWLIESKIQQTRFAQLKSHYFGSESKDQSPWSKHFVQQVLVGSAAKNIYLSQQRILNSFDNSVIKDNTQIGYGINYLAYTSDWLAKIATNVQLEQFKAMSYQSKHRAIITSETNAYAIPTTDPWYLSYTIAGQGFPMNNNILSTVYLGTAVYVVGQSVDKQWLLVLTPQFIGWVNATTVAYVNADFIHEWQKSIQHGLGAVIAPHTSILDKYGIILAVANSGSLLPLVAKNKSSTSILLPFRRIDATAAITRGYVQSYKITSVPLAPTYSNFRLLIAQLLGRTYGWGGYLGYNDCSADLQAIWTAFGFYMPRNSSQQVNVGKIVDLSNESVASRYNYLLKSAPPFTTLIYVPGHIMLYLGGVMYHKELVPLTYQNIWGMRKINESSRYIIGKSVLLPLLPSYSESADYMSLLTRPVFKLSLMNENTQDYDVANFLY